MNSARPPTPHRKISGWILSALVALALIITNGPALRSEALPSHDTLYAFSGFAIFSKHLKQYGEIPLWRPYSTFGSASDWLQLQQLSPASCFFSLLSAVRMSDNLVVTYKISILAEQALFAGACCWLSGLMYRNFFATIIFVISSLLTVYSWEQVFMNLRWVAGLPWILIFLHLGFQKRSRPFLLLSTLFVVSIVHGASYYAVLACALFWAVAFLTLCFQRKEKQFGGQWLLEKPSSREWLPLFLTLASIAVISGMLVTQILLVMSGQSPMSPGRDPATGASNLFTFLTYGGTFDIGRLFSIFSYGLEGNQFSELSLYLGIPMMTLAFVGLFQKGRMVSILRNEAIFFAAFSISGLLTLAIYYLPVFDNFRHVAYTVVFLRFALCALAGFGIQSLCEGIANRHSFPASQRALNLGMIIVAAILLTFSFPGTYRLPQSAGQLLTSFYELRISLIGALIFLGIFLLLRFRVSLPQAAPIILAGVALSGLAAVTWRKHLHVPFSDPEIAPVTRAFSTPILPIMERPADPLAIKSALEVMGGRRSVVYDPIDSALGIEMPLKHRYDVLPSDTAHTIRLFKNDTDALEKITLTGLPKVFLAHAQGENDANSSRVGTSLTIMKASPPTEVVVQADLNTPVTTLDFTFNGVTFGFPSTESTGQSRDRFLIYADGFHPEWQARLDKTTTPILKANTMFKAVKLEPDTSTVTFSFGSPFRKIAAWINFILAAAIFIGQVGLLILAGTRGVHLEKSGHAAQRDLGSPWENARQTVGFRR